MENLTSCIDAKVPIISIDIESIFPASLKITLVNYWLFLHTVFLLLFRLLIQVIDFSRVEKIKANSGNSKEQCRMQLFVIM